MPRNNAVTPPVMIRVYNDDHKGAAAFFRNRPFLDAFTRLLFDSTDTCCHVLVHASSIGCEPYSLALWWIHRYGNKKRLSIDVTDIDAAFIKVAKEGVYPSDILYGLTAEERQWFELCEEGVRVPESARELVNFLPPMSFVDGVPPNYYDAVLVMNALTYVSPEQQTAALNNIASYTTGLLALTAFHQDSIKSDIQRINFSPMSTASKKFIMHGATGCHLSRLIRHCPNIPGVYPRSTKQWRILITVFVPYSSGKRLCRLPQTT